MMMQDIQQIVFTKRGTGNDCCRLGTSNQSGLSKQEFVIGWNFAGSRCGHGGSNAGDYHPVSD